MGKHQTHQKYQTHIAYRARKTSQTHRNKRSFKLTHQANLIGWSCLGLFGLISLITVSPSSFSPSAALQNTTETTSTTATVKAAASLSVSLTPTVEISSMPTSNGAFNTGEAILNVGTNNLKGYSVYVNTEDPTTAMTRNNAATTEESTYKIQTLTNPTTSLGFTANTWGYSLTAATANDATVYHPISSLDQPMLAGGGATQTNGDTYHLTFGAKIDQALPAGQYSNRVAVSVIANPLEITKLSELTYMQDMSSDICANTGEITVGNEIEKQLIDVRDGKKYWVAKLADQNCWMTQNLALELNKETLPLTSSTSDVEQDWNPTSETSFNIPTTAAPYNGTASWNLGNYVLATPQHPICNEITEYSQCSLFQDVTNWLPNFTAQTGQWNDYYGYIAANATTQTYDPHYTVGNFYQYNTATAGSSTISNDPSTIAGLSDAKDSICPKGWQLPVSGSWSYPDTINREDSFYQLIKSYGYPTIDMWAQTSWALETPFKMTEHNYVVNNPIYFVAVGMINMENLKIHGASGWGYNWTSTNTGKDWLMPVNSYNASKIYISEIRSGNALPVRCLAK